MCSEAKQPLVLNTTQSDDLLKVVPRKPLLSSQSLNWDGCCLHYSQQPAWETPDFCEIHHLIIVNNSHTIQAKRRLDNRRQHEQFNKGDIVLIPANSSSYQRYGVFLVVFGANTHCSNCLRIDRRCGAIRDFALLRYARSADLPIFPSTKIRT